jgi:demethoxyubiquinone hydroxylase (CLK1/Coq7/Cat5 family)
MRCNARDLASACSHTNSIGATTTAINFSPAINREIQSFLSKSPAHPLAARAISDLRSDHAGEWGAVKIYEGAAMAAEWRLSFDPDARALTDLLQFVRRHRESESSHLAIMSQLLPREHRTRLLPLWTAAGFLLGAVRVLPSDFFQSDLCSAATRALTAPVCSCPCWLAGLQPCNARIPSVYFCNNRCRYRTVVHVETFVEQHYNEQGRGPHSSNTSNPEPRTTTFLKHIKP